MKLKTLIAATALVAISGSAMAADNADAFEGQIQFSGGFITQTCNVYVDASNSSAGTNGVTAVTKSGYVISGYKDDGKGNLVQNEVTPVAAPAIVSLGYYPLTALTSTSSTTTAQPFSITLDGCAEGTASTGEDDVGGTNVGLGFTADVGKANVINVTGKNAGIVGVGISTGSTAGTYVAVNGQEVATATIPAGETESNAVEFNAQYVLIDGTPVQGQAPALVTLNVIY